MPGSIASKTRGDRQPAPATATGSSPPRTVEFGDLTAHAGTFLRVFGQYMNSRVDELMDDHPIGPGLGKTSTLQIIAHNPGISQIEIAEIFGRDRSAQFRITADLEKRGLIYRETDPNERRRQNLYVTDKGRAMIPELERLAYENDARVFAALTPAQQRELRKLLLILWKSTLTSGSSYWRDVPEDLDV